MQDAQNALTQQANAPSLEAAPAAPEIEPALPFRSDTILGVCEALGQDFGFNPTYLRVVLAALVLWNPVAMIAIYLGLGLAVALARWIYPAPPQAVEPQVAAHPAAHVADNQGDEELLAA